MLLHRTHKNKSTFTRRINGPSFTKTAQINACIRRDTSTQQFLRRSLHERRDFRQIGCYSAFVSMYMRNDKSHGRANDVILRYAGLRILPAGPSRRISFLLPGDLRHVGCCSALLYVHAKRRVLRPSQSPYDPLWLRILPMLVLHFFAPLAVL